MFQILHIDPLRSCGNSHPLEIDSLSKYNGVISNKFEIRKSPMEEHNQFILQELCVREILCVNVPRS